jgi:hypothetical protein
LPLVNRGPFSRLTIGAAAAGIEHRRHRLVDRYLGRGQDEFAQPQIDRFELGRRIANSETPDARI